MRIKKNIDTVKAIEPEFSMAKGVDPATGELITAEDFNDAIFKMISNNGCLAHLDTDEDTVSDIVGRGEAINNASIIFYNRGTELFRNLIFRINTMYNDKVSQENPFLYRKMLDCNNRGRNHYPIEHIKFICLSTYRYTNIDKCSLPTYEVDMDDRSMNSFTAILKKLCTLELYINMNFEDIKLIGLSAASLAYNEVMDMYYERYANIGLLDDYKKIAGEMTALLLANIEEIIDILFAEARGFYTNNMGAVEAGPFTSYEQMSSMYTNRRNERLSVFVKEN